MQPGSRPSERLRANNLTLPPPAKPAFDYIPARVVGDVIYVAGQLPKVDGVVTITGTCGVDIDVDRAREAATICALQGIASASDAVGGIDNIDSVVRVTGFVASSPSFHDQPLVLNAASKLLRTVFGEQGRHARSAIGVAALPRHSPVEIEFTFIKRAE